MPLWAKIYVVIFILFTISNMGFNLYMKNKILYVIYDLFANLFFALAMIAYWRPSLQSSMHPVVAIIFFLLISLEVYLSTMNGYEKLGLKLPEGISREDINKAATISIIFSAPAYITGGLAMLNLIVGK